MNEHITRIEVAETIHTMGETTDGEAKKFVEFLKSELSKEFPNAEIYVTLNNRQSSTTVHAVSAVDADGYPIVSAPDALVDEVVHYAWDKFCGSPMGEED